MDAPIHRYRGGVDLASLPLERLADVEVVVVDATKAGRAIGAEAFASVNVQGRAVLVRTDFSRHWGTEAYFSSNPFVTADAAQLLAFEHAAFVGIDSLNIDDTADLTRPVHSTLLAADVPIVEHLRGLSQLPDAGFRFFAVPVKVRGMGTFPVRAVGLS